MDHLNYYNLKEEPFTIMPLTNFYYHNDQHDQAFLRLSRAVENMKGLAVLVGDIGTGKTLLARRLLEELEPVTHCLSSKNEVILTIFPSV